MRRGFPTPPIARAGHLTSLRGQGKEREIPSPRPFRRCSPTQATRECLSTLCAHQPGTAHVPMTTRVRFHPSSHRPSLSSRRDAPSRAHAPPGASWQQVLDPAPRSAAYPESHTAEYRDTDDRYRSTRCEKEGGGRELGKRNLGPQRVCSAARSGLS